MNQEIEKIKVKLIGQEHRIWAVFRNFWRFGLSEDKPKRKASWLALFFNFFLSRSTISITLIGILGFYLNWQNNKLLEQQNELLLQQNDIAIANRNSSAIALFNNVIDKIDEELKSPTNEQKTLSSLLIARIISLTNALEPYKVDEMLLSPEKGHLLTILAQSNINYETLEEIYKRSNFRNTDLRRKVMKNSYLNHIDLSDARIDQTDLQDSDLSFSKLQNVYISESNFNDTEIRNTVISGILNKSTFFNSHLKGSKLNQLKITNCNFTDAGLESVEFFDSYVNNSHFHNTNLSEATGYTCKGQKFDKPYQRFNVQVDCNTTFSGMNANQIENTNYYFDTIFVNPTNELLNSKYFKTFNMINMDEGNIICLVNLSENTKHNML